MSSATAAPMPVAEVRAAARRIRPLIRRTPLERSRGLSAVARTEVLLKLESLQRSGSFKLRGAANALLAHQGAADERRVVTASAGNHGLGLALAAREIGAMATVFVPESAPAVKQRRIAAAGAQLIPVAGGYDHAHDKAIEFAANCGARYIHAFSDPLVVAGQGTVALEIFEDCQGIGTLLLPVGGGGLLGGCGSVVRALSPATRVIGVQSEHTDAMARSFAAGTPSPHPALPTICDGLAGKVDQASFALALEVTDRIVRVPEAAVRPAIRYLYENEGIIAEGSAAVVAAALLSGVLGDAPPPVAAVVSGGNLDAHLFAGILED